MASARAVRDTIATRLALVSQARVQLSACSACARASLLPSYSSAPSQPHMSLPASTGLYDGEPEGYEERFVDDPFGPSTTVSHSATDAPRKFDMVLHELHELSSRFSSQEAELNRWGQAIQNSTQKIERILQQQMQRLMGWLSQVKAVFEREVATRGEEDMQDDGLWAQP